MNLFEASADPADRPLAERLRPARLDDFRGQPAVLKTLRPFLERPDRLPNLIFWGPPGSGKTTLARVLAARCGAHYVTLNAVETGAREIRTLGEEAHHRKISGGGPTLVFIDEIHRLNRGQQDVLLPFTEAGDFTLLGATTENPSYELNSALLSRARVVVFDRLTTSDLGEILDRALGDFKLSRDQLLTPAAAASLFDFADGDARKLLTAVELLRAHAVAQGTALDPEDLGALLQSPGLRYDKKSSEHYDTISAFIKSVRGSDADAAVYYLARMLAGGEDPVFIARRLVILASEDIGNADPRGLSVAVAGLQAVELVGMPEAEISLAQVTTYLASAPKSNASYKAIKSARALVEKTGSLAIPTSLRSARTRLGRELGFGEGYHYAHEGETGWRPMEFLPEELRGSKFYEPVDRGFEKTIRTYAEWVKKPPAAD